MSQKGKPPVFGDIHRRCLVSSIAGYELREDGVIYIFLKSGETVELQFNVDYLAAKAMEKLDGYFKVDTPEGDPCEICVRKDVEDPALAEDDHIEDKTYCKQCDDDEFYVKFREPGKDPHD